MAKSVVEGKPSDFWSEVKRIKGCKSTVTASVDGIKHNASNRQLVRHCGSIGCC